jgi:hypothetical protein
MAAAQAILPRMKTRPQGGIPLVEHESQVLQGYAIQFLLVEREDGECRVDLAVLLAEFAGLLLNSCVVPSSIFNPRAKLLTGHIL